MNLQLRARRASDPHIPRRLTTIGISVAAALLMVACSQAGQPDVGTSLSPTADASATALNLVIIGDSIPYNSDEDCPGCTSFDDLYAKSLAAATNQSVETANLSKHTGLTLPGLLDELDSLEPQLVAADVIVVGIAHNSFELNSEKPCGATFDEATNQMSDWSKINKACGVASASKYRPQFERLYSSIAAMRTGKPTVLRTINRYNDWIGWTDARLTAAQQKKTTVLLDPWNDMICTVAEEHKFGCADIYHAFNGPDGSKASGELLADDYTHPSEKGNALIAQVLIDQGFAPLA